MPKQKERLTFVTTEKTKGVIEKLEALATKEDISLNKFLSNLFLKITKSK